MVARQRSAIVAGWDGQNLDDLTISEIGRDMMRGFASGQWIELIDDKHELSGTTGNPGQAEEGRRQHIDHRSGDR